MKKITMKIGAMISALFMAVSMLTVPAFAADPGFTYDPGQGAVIYIEKYLVMDKEANVPNLTFHYTIEPGAAQYGAYNTASTTVNLPIWAGDDPDKVQGTPGIDRAYFEVGQTTYAVAQDNENELIQNKDGSNAVIKDRVNLAADGSQKYARTKIAVEMYEVQFSEPGIYRYVITERTDEVTSHEDVVSSDAIIFDTDTTRILDVYVVDDNGELVIEGYVLHNTEESAGVLENGTSQQPTKATGFQNTYVTEDLTIAKEISGNQASRDEYFEFTVEISNAVPGTVYDVVDTDADPNVQTFDRQTKVNAINADQYRNATALTVGEDGTVRATYWLQGGQSLKICGLAKGTAYSVNENKTTMDNEAYEVTATISGDTKYNDSGNAAGTNITLDDASVQGEAAYRMDDNYIKADTTVTFTNRKVGVIPTGVVLSVLPGAAVTLAGAAGLAVLFAKKRKKEEED